MSEQQGPEQSGTTNGEIPPSMNVPFSEIEAIRAQNEALGRASRSSSGEFITGGQGRVEEETRRLTERLTREEQERRRALTTTAPLIPEHVTVRTLPERREIRRALIALDGSTFAERTAPYAVALARMTGATIALGGCERRLNHPLYSSHVIDPAIDAETLRGDLIAQSLSRVRGQLGEEDFDAEARIIYAPDIVEGLIKLEEEVGADALALATHARHGMQRVALGSVADEVVRRGRTVALVVPPLAPQASPEAGAGSVTFSRVLVPLDGSELAEHALGVLRGLFRHAPTQVDEPTRQPPSTVTLYAVAETPAEVNDSTTYLDEVREALVREANGTVVLAKVALGSPPGSIAAEAAGAHAERPYQEPYDLIVMSTHGRGGVNRWLFGSVAEYVVSHSEVPLLLTRADTK